MDVGKARNAVCEMGGFISGDDVSVRGWDKDAESGIGGEVRWVKFVIDVLWNGGYVSADSMTVRAN